MLIFLCFFDSAAPPSFLDFHAVVLCMYFGESTVGVTYVQMVECSWCDAVVASGA